jgi:hypothetical protein
VSRSRPAFSPAFSPAFDAAPPPDAPILSLTPDELLTYCGAPEPHDTADLAWASLVIAGATAGISRALNRGDAPVLEPGASAELTMALRFAAAEGWKRREAPFAVLPYADLSGAAVRLSRDYLESIRPILQRWNRVSLA